MSSIFIVIFGLVGFTFGWFVYSKFIAEKIYRLDPNFETPAHRFEDGVDYVPTNKFVLWGSHFTAVAGAAPIVGPAIAVYWGWAPALLWVTFGSIFFAGVHDFGALWASNRHDAKSIGALSESIVSTRVDTMRPPRNPSPQFRASVVFFASFQHKKPGRDIATRF